MMVWQIGTLLGSFLGAVILTPLFKRLAMKAGAVDDPLSDPERKKHGQPIPLWGGLAVISASVLTWLVLLMNTRFTGTEFPAKYVVGLIAAAIFLAIGGALDDRLRWSPKKQIIWPLLAIIAVGAVGIGVYFITNPFGGLIYLNTVQWEMFRWGDIPYHLTLWADLFTLIWLLGAMYTTKILDGLDGLVSGVGVIGALIIFLLTQQAYVAQPAVGLIALSLAGAAGGFLIYNWSPAKIFLGESGSLFIGFILGVLSIISGGKIATALLILGLPILDLAWVIVRRAAIRHASPFTTADRSHLHFRLLDAGLSVRQSVLLLYAIIAIFGLSTLFVTGWMKVTTLSGNLVALVALAWWVTIRIKRRRTDGGVA